MIVAVVVAVVVVVVVAAFAFDRSYWQQSSPAASICFKSYLF